MQKARVRVLRDDKQMVSRPRSPEDGRRFNARPKMRTDMLTGIFARLFGCLCISSLGMMPGRAEPNALCHDIELSRGIIGHGAKLCHTRWLSGASWLALSVGANQCAANGIHDIDNLLGGGFKIFDGSAKAIGLEAACDLLDTFLQDTDKVARFVSDKHEPHPHYDDEVLSAITNVVLAVREAGKITPSQNRQYTLDGEALPSECDLIAPLRRRPMPARS